jgi:predicted DNA-binding transcriptional regulator YafY
LRADRLLSMLMLLQSRGKLSAAKLADELEVSIRTIHRDIEALSSAGVPVCVERGINGGCSLLGDYRTNLTGLNRDEIYALFMLGIPASLAELGVSNEIKTAFRKFIASLPLIRREDAQMVRQRIYLDGADWTITKGMASHLQTIKQAIWDNTWIKVIYTGVLGAVINELLVRTVAPLGLVYRAGDWYLVCAASDAVHVFRISHVLEVEILNEPFVRPPGFDLVTFWQKWYTEQEACRSSYPVIVRISPVLASASQWILGERLRRAIDQTGQPETQGFVRVRLDFESFNEARNYVLGFGIAMEVLEPESLRLSVVDYAKQIVTLYNHPSSTSIHPAAN